MYVFLLYVIFAFLILLLSFYGIVFGNPGHEEEEEDETSNEHVDGNSSNRNRTVKMSKEALKATGA